MRRIFGKGALGLVLLWGLAAAGQTPADKDKGKEVPPKARSSGKGTAITSQSPLDELLAKALRDNPDLSVASAKVQEAEANLNQVRLQVAQKVVALHQQLGAQRAMVRQAEAELARLRTLRETGVAHAGDALAAESALQKAKANLAKAEAEMTYLIGQQPAGVVLHLSRHVPERRINVRLGPDDRGGPVPPAALSRPVAEKIRKALDMPINLPRGSGFENTKLGEILEFLQDRVTNAVNIQANSTALGDQPVTVRLAAPVSLGAFLQLLEDRLGVRFVVRDYGIVATTREEVPPGAVTVYEFWKSERGKTVAPEKTDGK
jgi:hypothetical protein